MREGGLTLFWCRNQMYPPYLSVSGGDSVSGNRWVMVWQICTELRILGTCHVLGSQHRSPPRPCLFLMFGPALKQTSVSSTSVFSFYGDSACQIELCSRWQRFQGRIVSRLKLCSGLSADLLSAAYFHSLLPHHTWQYLLESLKHGWPVQWQS